MNAKIISSKFKQIKIQRNNKIIYIAPVYVIEKFKREYTVRCWKFPKVNFIKNNMIEYEYIHDNIIKDILYIIKSFVKNECYSEDTLNNIKGGKLIDFEELNLISRFKYICRLFENKYTFRFLKRFNDYMYGKRITKHIRKISNQNYWIVDDNYEIIIDFTLDMKFFKIYKTNISTEIIDEVINFLNDVK